MIAFPSRFSTGATPSQKSVPWESPAPQRDERAASQARVGVSISLIFLSALLTTLGVYDNLAKHAGAGMLVPITGFANSVASSAIEYKAEGQVFGIGCKIFTIAGPVILYGILSSWILGVIYYLFTMIP